MSVYNLAVPIAAELTANQATGKQTRFHFAETTASRDGIYDKSQGVILDWIWSIQPESLGQIRAGH